MTYGVLNANLLLLSAAGLFLKLLIKRNIKLPAYSSEIVYCLQVRKLFPKRTYEGFPRFHLDATGGTPYNSPSKTAEVLPEHMIKMRRERLNSLM